MKRFHRMFLFLGFVVAALVVSVPALAEFDSDPQTTWGVQTKGNSNTIGQWAALAWEIDQVNGTVFIGGNYLEVSNGSQVHSQPYLSAFDADTGAWQSWFDPDVGSAVFAMQPTSDGGLLVGGEIDTWNGETVGSLVKIDPATGERWPGFNTRVFGGNAVVRDLKLEADGYVYAVGNFPFANEGDGAFAVSGAIRFDPITGEIDKDWTPQIEDGTAWGVSRSKTQDITYIAGFFQSVDGDNDTRGFVGLDDDGEITTRRTIVPFNGCTTWDYCSQMYDVEATEAGHIWVAGVEHALYVVNESDGSLVKQHYTACNPAVQDCNGRDWVGGEFQEIERVGDRVYAGCHCWHDLYSDTKTILHRNPTGEHNTVNSLAAFDATTADVVQTFAPELQGDSGAFGIHVNPIDGCLWVAGGFSSYGAPDGPQPIARDVVRLCDETYAGPVAGPSASPPPPLNCVATGDETGITIDWDDTATSVGTILYRSVEGGPSFWNGRVNPPADSTFATGAVDNKQTQYFAQHVYPAGQRSVAYYCGSIDLRPNLTPATSCSAVVDANNNVNVNWTAGGDNADFIVRRSVDGSTNYWRARVDATSYTDTSISIGRDYTFSVQARDAGGVLAELTPCGDAVRIDVPQAVAIGSCDVAITAQGNLAVLWTETQNSDRYIVRRSVDGSTNYWRARVEDTAVIDADLTWEDSSITRGRSYTFSVEAVGADGTVAAATLCQPGPFIVPQLSVPAAASCQVQFDGSAYTVEWTYSVDPADAIVERSKQPGGSWGWRARTSGASMLDDRIEPGFDYSYRVFLLGDNGQRSDAAYCTGI